MHKNSSKMCFGVLIIAKSIRYSVEVRN